MPIGVGRYLEALGEAGAGGVELVDDLGVANIEVSLEGFDAGGDWCLEIGDCSCGGRLRLGGTRRSRAAAGEEIGASVP